jgi:hypothetical protein
MLMSGEMTDEGPRVMSMKERFDVWWVLAIFGTYLAGSGLTEFTGWLMKGGGEREHGLQESRERRTNSGRFVGAFALLHAMVFAFGFMNYYLKVRWTRPFLNFNV